MASKATRLIFQLGTNNWQVPGEFAPGSGILHEAHHDAYNSMEATKCFSIFPSKTQTSDRRDVIVFRLQHDIPICESVSPASSYRWHSMSDEEFTAYRERLEKEVYDYMDKVESEENANFSIAIAHHTFLNPIAMRNVLRKRKEAGKPHCSLVVFVHGTALKMYVHERGQRNPQEFPNRFLPWVKEQKVWADVDACFAISEQQVGAFQDIFPEFPVDRVVVSPNGVNQKVFHPIEGVSIPTLLAEFKPAEGSREDLSPISGGYDKMIVFVGKFANWKRLDSILQASAKYEKALEGKGMKTATIIIGTGPEEDKKKYYQMAKDLGCQHTYFIGPQPQPVLAKFYSAASVCVFPSFKEPFGMVFIESMACGAPVIGCNSGGPKDFVNSEVGELVKEHASDPHDLKLEDTAKEIEEAVVRAVTEDWKSSKGPKGLALAIEKYSTLKQVTELLENADRIIKERDA
mmetsp:Transcript_31159/g.87361  ORF Transcript_31159/g.87361 Transcript_31159/m.87361 type:complete len:461 (+) Transcript_31159:139-1521(+)|eukprot:CAMPEP_0119132064 /NCGR_PEP_ID=MMETSP1310-20130426/11312_1 /TAXON_ID=464262 /ORGANISM="Genus nov. species nov., Strain RCC2339" /LENGTH=460 /DNA_ID=CAMNT_0007122675 /DNA_START=71 /DNA_END=1453 /DNA_ORIENTATION=-